MNEYDQSTPVPVSAETSYGNILPESSTHIPAKPLVWWLKKLFACNPFYLASAALLLLGCYRVSLDAPFLNLELARLWFNFSSVQVYEILVVFTAILLAKRNLRYDSNLLVWLENLLIFVPFILISQAALIDAQPALIMSVGGGLLAIVRSGALKRILPHVPRRLLGAGFIMLALNIALPLIYRHFGETKIGVHIDIGPAYVMNECTWLLILPAVLALANFLPSAQGAGNLPSPDRWQSDGLFTLWLAVTGVHVYSLDYIYQFDLRPELLAPAAWVFVWTIWLRLSAPLVWMKYLRYALTATAICLPLLAFSAEDHRTFLILAALNIIACAGTCFVEYGHRLARHLTFGAVLMFIAGLPDAWMRLMIPGLSQGACVAVGVVAYPLALIVLSRNPKLAILGSFMAGWVTVTALNGSNAGNWAMQAGFVFFILHSLRWNDVAHKGAKTVRILVVIFWVAHSLLWMDSDVGRYWMTCVSGFSVLVVYVSAQNKWGKWRLPEIPAAAILATLSGPCVSAAENVCNLPVGLLAVIGSFLLFGCGTMAALTRSHWHKSEPKPQTAHAPQQPSAAQPS